MHVMTTNPPELPEGSTAPAADATPKIEAAAWQWVPDQRAEPTPARPSAATFALAAHRRPLLEPIHRPRQIPTIQLDAARRRPDIVDAAPAGDEAGQATAEYALVLLAAAAIALVVASWATKTNLVGKFLDVIFNQLIGRATSGH